jgi:TorA maturation chaperone TorD/DNA-binding transcriptional regulator YdaS (Cro superfamily)
MRDHGLNEAIRAAGGVSELARRIGISQPSVSNWNRVPAERVLDVEAATGVERVVLRPDLYGAKDVSRGEITEVDSGRSQEYALLAALLGRAPDADFLARLARLRGDATPLGVEHSALAQASADTTEEKVEREYFNLFIGIGRGELLPYGSYYLTGFLHERPLARLRADLNELGVERAAGIAEPEDHVAILCETMSGLITGKFPSRPGADREFFEKHMRPWIGRFFTDLEQAEGASFYRYVGRLGRMFVDIETEAFALPS